MTTESTISGPHLEELPDGSTALLRPLSSCLSHGSGQAARDRLRVAVFDQVDRGRSRILLDLEFIELMDSGGLGWLISLANRLEELEASLALCGVNAAVRRLFELTQLDRVFTILEPGDDLPGRE